MERYPVIAALRRMWGELPDLCGEAWQELEPELRRLLDEFDSAEDDEARQRASARAQRLLLRVAPEAQRRLAELVEELEVLTLVQQTLGEVEAEKWAEALASKDLRRQILDVPRYRGDANASEIARVLSELSTAAATERGTGAEYAEMSQKGIDFAARESPSPAAAVTQAITRYTDILCPERVWVKSPYVPVIVRLTVSAPTVSRDVQALVVSEALPVRVHITAPAFDLLTPADQEIVILPDRDSLPVTFLLRPLAAGPAEVILDFFQGGVPVGRTASLTVEVTEQPAEEALSARPAGPLPAGQPGVEPADLMLVITQERFRDQPQLRFTLYRGRDVSVQDFTPVPLESPPEQFAARLYSDLEQLGKRVRGAPQAGPRHLGDDAGGAAGGQDGAPAEEVSRTVKRLAQNIWRDLIPDDLKQLYTEERGEWSGKSLAVISDEPHLPWELVWPYGDGWQDEGPWCVTTHMTRWLRRDARRRGNATAPPQVPLRELACIAPAGDLPFVAIERDFLTKLVSRRGLRDASPRTADLEAVLALLGAGGYDWVHVATHGNFDPDAPDRGSGVSLERSGWLTPADVVGPEIEGCLRQRRPAFIFNVCRGAQAGWGLTRMGGWADRLIGAGASLFVSSVWSAQDKAAEAFARAFYSALEGGATVGAAATAGRLAARDAVPGDPTWLAYSVYAHPNARVAWPEA